jgi:hypothetical protein
VDPTPPSEDGEQRVIHVKPAGDDEDPPSFTKLAAVALETFAFPLLLAILVGLYLLIQYWIDRKDPKLAVAPVLSNHDLASFG